MLNKIWPIFLIVSIIYAVFSGNLENVSNGIFIYAGKAVELSITFRNHVLMDRNYRNNKKYFFNK